MTGVEILAMEEVVTAYAFNWGAYIITLIVTVFICGVIGIITGWPLNVLSGLCVGMIVGFLVGGILGLLPGFTTLPKEYETRYKVTISDEVFMNDFLERYEIIDQEGKIYTVRERVVADGK